MIFLIKPQDHILYPIMGRYHNKRSNSKTISRSQLCRKLKTQYPQLLMGYTTNPNLKKWGLSSALMIGSHF